MWVFGEARRIACKDYIVNCSFIKACIFFFTKGLLHAKLDHLYAICGAENSPVFQSYTVSPCKHNIFKMKDMKTQISMRFKLKNNMVMRLYYALVLKFHV